MISGPLTPEEAELRDARAARKLAIEQAPELAPDRNPNDELRKVGEAFKQIADALEPLPDDKARLRVLKAVAILVGVELP